MRHCHSSIVALQDCPASILGSDALVAWTGENNQESAYPDALQSLSMHLQEWLDTKTVVIGTKCNRLLLLNTITRKVRQEHAACPSPVKSYIHALKY